MLSFIPHTWPETEPDLLHSQSVALSWTHVMQCDLPQNPLQRAKPLGCLSKVFGWS